MGKSRLTYIFIIFGLFSFLSFCYVGSGKKVNNDKIVCIEVVQMYPQITETGKLTGYKPNPVRVYYYKNMKSYKLTYDFDSTVDGVLMKSEQRYHYFVFRQGQNYGFDYNPFRPKPMNKLTLDSAFKFEWIEHSNWYRVFTGAIVELVSSKMDNKSEELEEAYVFRSKTDSTILGTCILSFNHRLKEFDVSISKELDSLKQMKLYKAKFINKKKFYSESGVVDEYEFRYTLKEIPVTNPDEILSYFSRFMEDDKK